VVATLPASATTPIEATLNKAAERIEYFSGSFGEAPDGWYRASDVVDNPNAVNELLDKVFAIYDMNDRQIGAAFLILGYFWSPMLAALACYTLDRRVPDLSANAIAFDLRQVRFTSPRFAALPDDPAAGHPDVEILPDRDALRDRLVGQLETDHAAPLFRTLRSVAPYGLNGMQANYVDRLVSALVWIADALGDPQIARDEVPAFVNRMTDKRRAGYIELQHEGRPGVFQLRGGCCLNYRLPGNEKCDTCSLRPMDERIEIFRGLLADGAPSH
jgi:hypothetical protein